MFEIIWAEHCRYISERTNIWRSVSHLAEGRFVVQSRAAVSMSASSDFKIEGTIDPGTKRQSQHEHIVHFGLVTVDKVRDLRNIVSKTQTKFHALFLFISVLLFTFIYSEKQNLWSQNMLFVYMAHVLWLSNISCDWHKSLWCCCFTLFFLFSLWQPLFFFE